MVWQIPVKSRQIFSLNVFNPKTAIGSGGMGILPMCLSILETHWFVRAILTGRMPVPLDPAITVSGFNMFQFPCQWPIVVHSWDVFCLRHVIVIHACMAGQGEQTSEIVNGTQTHDVASGVCTRYSPYRLWPDKREDWYLLRTNLETHDPGMLWRYYMQLVFVEEAFRTLKADLAIRPVYHQLPQRIKAHPFISFLAYCLSITLCQRLKAHAPGLTPRVVFEKNSTLQMLDVHIPVSTGAELVLTRHSEPDEQTALLLDKLELKLRMTFRSRGRFPFSTVCRVVAGAARLSTLLHWGEVKALYGAPRPHPSVVQ